MNGKVARLVKKCAIKASPTGIQLTPLHKEPSCRCRGYSQSPSRFRLPLRFSSLPRRLRRHHRNRLPSAGPGKAVETLQSEVLHFRKVRGKEHRRPRLPHLQEPGSFPPRHTLSFRLYMMDVFVSCDLITCLVPSKRTAYQGRVSQLPDGNALRGWGMNALGGGHPSGRGGMGAGAREYLAADGRKEIHSYDDRGLAGAQVEPGR